MVVVVTVAVAVVGVAVVGVASVMASTFDSRSSALVNLPTMFASKGGGVATLDDEINIRDLTRFCDKLREILLHCEKR